MFVCFLIVCQVFVFVLMLHARGNLDLESPMERLTSSGLWALGPSRPIAFWRFIFASFFVMCFRMFFHSIFDGF